jgi:hypothetical protein
VTIEQWPVGVRGAFFNALALASTFITDDAYHLAPRSVRDLQAVIQTCRTATLVCVFDLAGRKTRCGYRRYKSHADADNDRVMEWLDL